MMLHNVSHSREAVVSTSDSLVHSTYHIAGHSSHRRLQQLSTGSFDISDEEPPVVTQQVEVCSMEPQKSLEVPIQTRSLDLDLPRIENPALEPEPEIFRLSPPIDSVDVSSASVVTKEQLSSLESLSDPPITYVSENTSATASLSSTPSLISPSFEPHSAPSDLPSLDAISENAHEASSDECTSPTDESLVRVLFPWDYQNGRPLSLQQVNERVRRRARKHSLYIYRGILSSLDRTKLISVLGRILPFASIFIVPLVCFGVAVLSVILSWALFFLDPFLPGRRDLRKQRLADASQSKRVRSHSLTEEPQFLRSRWKPSVNSSRLPYSSDVYPHPRLYNADSRPRIVEDSDYDSIFSTVKTLYHKGGDVAGEPGSRQHEFGQHMRHVYSIVNSIHEGNPSASFDAPTEQQRRERGGESYYRSTARDLIQLLLALLRLVLIATPVAFELADKLYKRQAARHPLVDPEATDNDEAHVSYVTSVASSPYQTAATVVPLRDLVPYSHMPGPEKSAMRSRSIKKQKRVSFSEHGPRSFVYRGFSADAAHKE